MRVMKLNSSQQSWLEKNVKDFKKNVPYTVDTVLVYFLDEYESGGGIVFNMLGNRTATQIICSKQNHFVTWRNPEADEIREAYAAVNSSRIPMLSDNLFNAVKSFVNQTNGIW